MPNSAELQQLTDRLIRLVKLHLLTIPDNELDILHRLPAHSDNTALAYTVKDRDLSENILEFSYLDANRNYHSITISTKEIEITQFDPESGHKILNMTTATEAYRQELEYAFSQLYQVPAFAEAYIKSEPRPTAAEPAPVAPPPTPARPIAEQPTTEQLAEQLFALVKPTLQAFNRSGHVIQGRLPDHASNTCLGYAVYRDQALDQVAFQFNYSDGAMVLHNFIIQADKTIQITVWPEEGETTLPTQSPAYREELAYALARLREAPNFFTTAPAQNPVTEASSLGNTGSAFFGRSPRPATPPAESPTHFATGTPARPDSSQAPLPTAEPTPGQQLIDLVRPLLDGPEHDGTLPDDSVLAHTQIKYKVTKHPSRHEDDCVQFCYFDTRKQEGRHVFITRQGFEIGIMDASGEVTRVLCIDEPEHTETLGHALLKLKEVSALTITRPQSPSPTQAPAPSSPSFGRAIGLGALGGFGVGAVIVGIGVALVLSGVLTFGITTVLAAVLSIAAVLVVYSVAGGSIGALYAASSKKHSSAPPATGAGGAVTQEPPTERPGGAPLPSALPTAHTPPGRDRPDVVPTTTGSRLS